MDMPETKIQEDDSPRAELKALKEKRALSIAEAAFYTCVSRGIIEEWLKKGLLPFEELPGKSNGVHKFRRIRKTDLDAFLDQHYRQLAVRTEKHNNHSSGTMLLPRQPKMLRRKMLESR